MRGLADQILVEEHDKMSQLTRLGNRYLHTQTETEALTRMCTHAQAETEAHTRTCTHAQAQIEAETEADCTSRYSTQLTGWWSRMCALKDRVRSYTDSAALVSEPHTADPVQL